MLSITTDYHSEGENAPLAYFQRIAEARFSHVHWGHHFNGDFYYSPDEITRTKRMFDDLGLRLLDLHGSTGDEHDWVAEDEVQRQAGVELVKNRIELVHRCGGCSVIMHAKLVAVGETEVLEPGTTQLCKSLDDIRQFPLERNVWIAIENFKNFVIIKDFLGLFEPELVGFCYDSGHANLEGQNGLDFLQANRDMTDRIVSIHLHDNNGTDDLHTPFFSGTLDWDRVASVIASSSYDGCVSMETNMEHSGASTEQEFLRNAFAEGNRLTQMIDQAS